MRYLIGILIACMCISLIGCAYKKNGEDAIKYIDQKYGMEFHPISYNISDYLSEGDEIECYTDGMNPDNEHVSIFVKDGKFKDNYFEYIVRNEIEGHIESVVKEEVGECKVYKTVSKHPLPDSLNIDNTANDLYEAFPEYETWASIYIKESPGVSKSNYESRIEGVKERLSGDNRRYYIQAYVVDDNTYNLIDRYTVQDMLTDWLRDGTVDEGYVYELCDTYIDGDEIEEY